MSVYSYARCTVTWHVTMWKTEGYHEGSRHGAFYQSPTDCATQHDTCVRQEGEWSMICWCCWFWMTISSLNMYHSCYTHARPSPKLRSHYKNIEVSNSSSSCDFNILKIGTAFCLECHLNSHSVNPQSHLKTQEAVTELLSCCLLVRLEAGLRSVCCPPATDAHIK